MSRPADPKPTLKRGYWRVRIKGKDIHLGKDQRKAMAKFHQIMTDRLSRENSPGRPTTIAGAAEVWCRQHPSPNNVVCLRQFIGFVDGSRLDDVAVDLLHNYHDFLLARTYRTRCRNGEYHGEPRRYKKWTIHHYMRCAVAVMRLAEKRKWSEMPDVPRTARAGFVDRSTNRVELWRKLDAMRSPVAQPLRFIAATGCRPGEAVKLEWSHVHIDHRVCVLPEHKTADKTGEPRVLALTDEAIAVLRNVSRTAGHVFLNRAGKPFTTHGLCTMSRAHLGTNPYSLRHTFAQSCIDDGIAPETVTKLLGHKTSAMVWTYAKIKDHQLIAAAQNLKIRSALKYG